MQIRFGLITLLLFLVQCQAEAPSIEFGPVNDPAKTDILLRIPFFSAYENENEGSSRFKKIRFQVEGARISPPRIGMELPQWEPMQFTDIKVYGSCGNSLPQSWERIEDKVEDHGNGKYTLGPHIAKSPSICRRYLIVKVDKANCIYKVTITSEIYEGQRIQLFDGAKRYVKKPTARDVPSRKTYHPYQKTWTPNSEGSPSLEGDESRYGRKGGLDGSSSNQAEDYVD